ncbi:MAG: SIS domain-containing protein [Acidobacteriota bacterium]|nr:SIS domain-containing protein [Acidobacteriota bacterium]
MSAEQMKRRIAAQATSLQRVLSHHVSAGNEAMQQAAALMRRSRQIVITGMGASYYAALPLESHLCGLGMNVIAVEAGEYLHFRPHAYPDAVVVVVSRSGESIEIVKLLAALRGRQPVIGITNRPESRLAQSADIAIDIHSLDDDIVALQTYTGTLLALALLGRAVEQEGALALREAESLLPEVQRLVDASLASISTWDPFLSPGHALYLLARGGSFASALEGALLFHEVAKAPAVAMPTASFRHGPVEVVNDHFRAILFAPDTPTQPLNLALAQDLVRFGGEVRVIGPRIHMPAGLAHLETPRVPALYAPMLEILPVQVAALRLAEMRGIVPGSFRFAPPVATDEASFTTPLSQ